MWARQKVGLDEHYPPAGGLSPSLAKFRPSSSLLLSSGKCSRCVGGADPSTFPAVVREGKGSVGASRNDCKSLSCAMQFSILPLNPPPSMLNPQGWLTWTSGAGMVLRR